MESNLIARSTECCVHDRPPLSAIDFLARKHCGSLLFYACARCEFEKQIHGVFVHPLAAVIHEKPFALARHRLAALRVTEEVTQMRPFDLGRAVLQSRYDLAGVHILVVLDGRAARRKSQASAGSLRACGPCLFD